MSGILSDDQARSIRECFSDLGWANDIDEIDDVTDEAAHADDGRDSQASIMMRRPDELSEDEMLALSRIGIDGYNASEACDGVLYGLADCRCAFYLLPARLGLGPATLEWAPCVIHGTELREGD